MFNEVRDYYLNLSFVLVKGNRLYYWKTHGIKLERKQIRVIGLLFKDSSEFSQKSSKQMSPKLLIVSRFKEVAT